MNNEVLRKGLVAAVRIHALQHYSEGWDVIVEAWEDEDILKAVGNAQTVPVALIRVERIVKLQDEQRRAVQSEVF